MQPDILIGPPGCGKTHALLDIAKHAMDDGVSPEDIAFVSFTRRAAHEGSSRIGVPISKLPHWRTIHSTAYRALGLTPGDVLEGRRMQEFGDWAGVQLSRSPRERDRGVWVGARPGDRMVHMENLARVRCVSLREQYDAYDDNLPWNKVDYIAGSLNHYKQKRYLLDYTDMLSSYGGVVPPRLHTLLVDEAQDLSYLQWRVVEKMAQQAENVVVAGDDDQAIYPWAGAAVEYFVGMAGQTRVLGQSFRVPGAVQAVAAEIIAGVEGRRPKQWAARDEQGEVNRVVGLANVDFSSGSDILVLSRNHLFIERFVEPLLRQEGVFYEIQGKPSVDSHILKAIIDWETLRKGGEITTKAARAVLSYTSAIATRERELHGMVEDSIITMDILEQRGLTTRAVWHEALDKLPPEELSYILAMRTRGEKLNQRPRVKLSTIHGSKGAEAEHVVLLMSQTPRVVREALHNPWAEARVWYVAVTRARQKLTLVRDPMGPREKNL